MKKKYFTPEMEELEFDEPIVLSESDASADKEGIGGDCDEEDEG